MLTFDGPADSIAFGKTGTRLEGLMFVSHTAGKVADTGLAADGSELTMVDVATLRRIAVASSGSRGDVAHETSAGRLPVRTSNQDNAVSPVTTPTDHPTTTTHRPQGPFPPTFRS